MSSRGRILVVDDSALVRRRVSQILESGGFDVVVAEDGLAALERLHRDPNIDLMTLDVSMPRLDGFETCRLLRQTVLGGEVLPVILLTGNDPLSGRQRGFEVGATDFVVKGRARNQLLPVIEALLYPTKAYEGMRALLVNDGDRGVDMIGRTLRHKYGLSVMQAENGRMVAAADVLDLDLIAISGALASDPLRVCADLRMRLGEQVPILVVLDQASESRRLDCFNAGASDYLVAPILKEELVARLAPQLERRLLQTSTQRIEAAQRAPQIRQTSLKILVVDDTRLNRMVATAMLGAEGHRVETAGDGAPALAQIEDATIQGNPYDLVLMDRYMPGLTGIETTVKLRQWERKLRVEAMPVVGLTGTVDATSRAELMGAGMADVLKKPLNIGAFRRVMANLDLGCVR